jgi:dTDP-4-dehydrorhamnose 3,5-epimerase
MILEDTRIAGVVIVRPDRLEDDRGFFARTWDEDEFAARGLSAHVVQCSISFNRSRGTLRGLHYQAAPHEESKLVRCTAGAIFDVAVDLRPDSPTFKDWVGVELSADNRVALYIPEGCAHGFLTLADDSEIYYQMTEPYAPGTGRGARWDDPAFGIEWPGEVLVIHERDRTYPDFAALPAQPK